MTRLEYERARARLLAIGTSEQRTYELLNIGIEHGFRLSSFVTGFLNLQGKMVNFATVKSLIETAGSRKAANVALALYYDKEHPSR